MKTQIIRLAPLFLLLWLLSGCIRPEEKPKLAMGSCQPIFPAASNDTDAIRTVIAAEGQFVVSKEIEPLMALWADGGFIVNANHTPSETTDDLYWRDKDAIRHRYIHTVFNGDAKSIQPAELNIEITEERAEILATTRIDQEISRAGDRWTLVKIDGCWLIESLTFDLEPR